LIRKSGDTEVEIEGLNTSIPIIVITHKSSGEEYVYRDHEVDDLLAEVPKGVDPEDYLMVVSQGW